MVFLMGRKIILEMIFYWKWGSYLAEVVGKIKNV
jgi:hypothetical protein